MRKLEFLNNINRLGFSMQIIDNNRIRCWTEKVSIEPEAIQQLLKISELPFIFSHIAVMPDVHLGIGATVGSVIATKSAVVPAAVGVDIGCGMIAAETNIQARDLPNLPKLRSEIEKRVPYIHHTNSAPGLDANLEQRLKNIIASKSIQQAAERCGKQLGTLGGGNHFIEICLDQDTQKVWIMLHSGSRGIGNAIGQHYISAALEECSKWQIRLPNRDLAYLPEGFSLFNEYIEAVGWCQDYAYKNRQLMLKSVINALTGLVPNFEVSNRIINCHHNYVQKEHHFGSNVWITRKGAVSARKDQLGIIPGSMGAKSYIVKGKGNPESFTSCSHGAGRQMSRTKAKELFTIDDLTNQTKGVECRKDAGVIDEAPGAYKDIDAVMESQKDLVEIVHTLKQVLCVKG